MKDHLHLGSTPGDEQCAQVGWPSYPYIAQIECAVYIAQLRRQFGEPPEGARFGIIREYHTDYISREVGVHFDDSFPGAKDFAFHVDENAPATWDAEARADLDARLASAGLTYEGQRVESDW